MKSPDPELKSLLEKISSISQEMQENMNHIVWSLHPRNDHFDQMMLRLKNYAVEVLNTKNIIPRFEIDPSLNDIKLNNEQRKELFLIFKK
jgi:signal transduction histidine kinase